MQFRYSDIESVVHFFLRCPLYIKALLFGRNSFDTNPNTNVLNGNIEYILSTEWINEPLFQLKQEIFKQGYEAVNSVFTQKQSPRGAPRKRCSKNMQQFYRRTPMPKCDFNKVALHWCSPVNSLHIYRIPFPRNTSGWLFCSLE